MKEERGLTGNWEGKPQANRQHPDAAPSDRKELGARSEQLAAHYLKERGYTIVKRNYRTSFGEIDLICEQRDLIIFVEVRSKRSLRYGTGAESVNQKKQRKIRRVAEQFLLHMNWMNRRIRFDVIEIFYEHGEDGEKQRIRHLEGAF